MIDVYVGRRWISIRFFMHLIVLYPLLLTCSYIIGTEYAIVVSLALLVVYTALIYGQLKNPLLSLSDKKLTIVNLFYTGLKEIDLDSLEDVLITRRKVVVSFSGKQMTINVIGLPWESRKKLSAISRVLNLKYNS